MFWNGRRTLKPQYSESNTQQSLSLWNLFGLTVKPNRFQRDRDCFVIDSEFWGFNVLRPFQNTQLAKTGDNTHMLLLMEGGVVSRNEASSGIVADLTTS